MKYMKEEELKNKIIGKMIIDMEDFYVCPNHIEQGGYESCCQCGGWSEDEEERLCTEAIR